MSQLSEAICESENALKEKLIQVVRDNGIMYEVVNVVIFEPPELKGEHFATSTVYAQVQFKDTTLKPKNLFVKKFANNSLQRQMIEQMRLMEKESTFFNHFLPLVRSFCAKYPGCENLLNFFPKSFYADDEIVVLENLVLDDSFIMLDKTEQQDFYTASMVLRNLAKFHAANYAFIQDMGREEFKKRFEICIFESFDLSKNPMLAPMFDNGIETCNKILTGYPTEGSTETVEKLTGLVGKVFGMIEELILPNLDNPLLVLNHGDCWNNNMLFKKDATTGLVIDHIFVDFQITRYGSPCLDLGYFLFTSVQPDMRRRQLKELLEIYYKEFEATSMLFNIKCPISFEEFFLQFKKYSKLGYLFALTIVSAIAAFKEIDLEDTGTDHAEVMEKINNIIFKWISDNPETSKKISIDLVNLVREFENLQNQ